MKLIILAVAALVAVALAAPQRERAGPVDHQVIPIVRSDYDQQANGGYVYAFETGDGITKNENGEVKTIPDEDNKPQEVVVVRGSYAYTDPEGKPHSFTYYADETGFHVEGDDVPKTA